MSAHSKLSSQFALRRVMAIPILPGFCDPIV
jgi:hypothetical protein